MKRERQTSIRYNAATMKVKCWKRLLHIAMDKEITEQTVDALEAIINLAEPIETPGGNKDALCDN